MKTDADLEETIDRVLYLDRRPRLCLYHRHRRQETRHSLVAGNERPAIAAQIRRRKTA